jgi:threonine dehydrogenase-like Zn-dependent dehydrogenase
VAHRARLAQTLGADAAICTREAKLVESLRDLAGPHGIDTVYDAAAAAETMNAALEVLRPGGRLVLIGLPYEEWPKLDLYQALNKEIAIQTIRRSNHNDLAALDLLLRDRITDAMVSHRFPLAQTAEAFRLLEDYSDGVAKVVIEL